MPLYHVWFATKTRKWLLKGDVGEAVKELMWTVAKEKNIGLLECEIIIDHVHLLIWAEDGTRLSTAMNLLKGVTSRKIFQTFPELKPDARVGGLLAASICSKARF
jgi:putative transposase